eukprot:2211454-Amphidinium_carterae.1
MEKRNPSTVPGNKKPPIAAQLLDKEQHSMFRTAVGQLLWVSQLRVDTITTCWGSPLLHISRTQSTIALSSAEAELHAMGQATSEAEHIKQVIQEMTIPNMSKNINRDSSAGKAVASRIGLSKKTKHVQFEVSLHAGHCTAW